VGKDHYIRTLQQDVPVISLDAIRRKYKVSPTDKAANGRVVHEAKEEARSYLRKEQGFVVECNQYLKTNGARNLLIYSHLRG
jgi:predicted kinase